MRILKLEDSSEENKLKGGENGHLNAHLLGLFHDDEEPLVEKDIYSEKYDLGAKVRKKGWTNIGDISACLRTSHGLGQIYHNTATPHVAVSSKHCQPVALGLGETQYEAVVKAIAGDLNSPFGGFLGFNSPLTRETAEFIDKMFIEGVVAPEHEDGVPEMLQDTSKVKNHANRFLIQTGELSPSEVDGLTRTITMVAMGKFLEQDREKPFDVRKEAVVVTGNEGNTDINSLDKHLLDDIQFAGNAALYLGSNLVFYVHDGAIAGLGNCCGARTFAAEKARRMLEISVYAALSSGSDQLWERILYDTPFNREEFERVIKTPIRLKGLSDAFVPKMDAFVEMAGLDRIVPEFASKEYTPEGHKKPFIPKRWNYD